MAKTENKMYIRISEAQEKLWRLCAQAEGVSLSKWVRANCDYYATTNYVQEMSWHLGVPTGRMLKKYK